MKQFTILFSLTLCLWNGRVQSQDPPSTCPILVWSDEFDGTSLDDNTWTPQLGDGCQRGRDLCGWGNNEAQWYRGENAEVSNGMLKIVAKRETFGSPPKQFTSARIRSFDKVTLDLTQDLLIEARIKVPTGQGLWPAFWLMPSPEVEWPSGGEIDIMEFIGREPYFAQGYMHYGNQFGDKLDAGGPIRLPEELSEDFHVFSLIKRQESMTWLFDGHIYQSYDSEDIEPKYTWPFERSYHILLNVAVGGNWPEYPDETSTFPTSMDVDYVRVFNLNDDKLVTNIAGTRLVHQNQAPFSYCIEPSAAAVQGPVWEVPSDASFVTSPNKAGCIDVTFGTQSGYVKASVPNPCNDGDDVLELSVPVQVQAFYEKDFSLIEPSITNPLGISQGETLVATGDSQVINLDGFPTWEYTRSTELFDNFQLQVPIQNIEDYLEGEQKFFLDMRTTTSAPCTRILIQLEDSSSSLPDNYPVGRHSRYECLIEPTREWQRIACDYKDRIDRSVNSADRVTVLIDPGVSRVDGYYIRNFDVSKTGCTQNCEPLQASGASTSNCRRGMKSEAGACTDNVNNNEVGYDGNFVTDCADPMCFLIDPMCGGPTSGGIVSPSAPTVSPTTAPVVSPTLTPVASPTDPPISPTEAPITPTEVPVSPTAAPLAPTPMPVSPTLEPTSSPTPMPVSTTTTTTAPVNSPTIAPASTSAPFTVPNPTDSPIGPPFDGPRECSLNPACAGLADDCCPTILNIFLYCCFEELPIPVGFTKETTLVAPQIQGSAATYEISTAPYFDPGTAPDGSFPVIAYQRSVNEVYDNISYQTSAITSVEPYLNGDKKFFMEVWTNANECTQIVIELNSLSMATPSNYPSGRSSRYIAFTTKTDEWEILEFDLLDQPDGSVPDDDVNGMVLFLGPGARRVDTYYIRSIYVGVDGCSSSDCIEPSLKSCPAIYEGEDGACTDGIDNDLDRLVDCEDPDCTSDPACTETLSLSLASATSFLRAEDDFDAAGVRTSSDAYRYACTRLPVCSLGFVFATLTTGFFLR